MRFALLAALGLLGLSFPKPAPAVSFSYAVEFDSACSQQTGYRIDPAWAAEVRSRLPELTSNWTKEGTLLLKESEAIVGKPYPERQTWVSLSVCSMPSMADPMLVNMRFSLHTFTDAPLTEDVTFSIVFHELLHRYLLGKIPPDSALLAKYSNEDDTVKAHLHLLALQEATYRKLGRDGTLARVIATDRLLPNKSYGRAWDIIAREGYQPFVAELCH